MGVTGLWKQKEIQKGLVRRVSLNKKHLGGRRVAIDLNIYLMQWKTAFRPQEEEVASGTLLGLFSGLCKLKRAGVDAVFVLDGELPMEKSVVHEERMTARMKQVEKAVLSEVEERESRSHLQEAAAGGDPTAVLLEDDGVAIVEHLERAELEALLAVSVTEGLGQEVSIQSLAAAMQRQVPQEEVVDPSIVEQLMGMGFEHAVAMKALQGSGGDLLLALEQLLAAREEVVQGVDDDFGPFLFMQEEEEGGVRNNNNDDDDGDDDDDVGVDYGDVLLQPSEVLSLPPTSSREEMRKQLVGMGFGRSQVDVALRKTNSLEEAVTSLLQRTENLENPSTVALQVEVDEKEAKVRRGFK